MNSLLCTVGGSGQRSSVVYGIHGHFETRDVVVGKYILSRMKSLNGGTASVRIF